MVSDLAQNYGATKKVQSLLDKLADYMGGNFDKTQFLSTGELEKKPSKKKKKEVRSLSRLSNQKLAADNLNPISKALIQEPMQIEVDDQQESEEDKKEELLYLPQLSPRKLGGDRNKLGLPARNHLFTYKEMDFSLTQVGGNQRFHPLIGQTTYKKGQEQIRDNLMQFHIRHGSMSYVDQDNKFEFYDRPKKYETISVPYKVKNSHSMVHVGLVNAIKAQNNIKIMGNKQAKSASRFAQRTKKNLKHQAYWVHEKQEGETAEDGASSKAKEKDQKMQLVNQYVMLNGRLQPALKYKYANPMYNRYKFETSEKKAVKEMITLPSLAGDIQFSNDYVGVSKKVASPRVDWDDSQPTGIEANLSQLQVANHLAKQKSSKLLSPRKVTTLGGAGLMYKRDLYSMSPGQISDDNDELDDPRTLNDLEQEHQDLSEQLKTQLLSVEQYLGIAKLWLIDQQEKQERAFETFDVNMRTQTNVVEGQTIVTEQDQDGEVQPVWRNYNNQSELEYKIETFPQTIDNSVAGDQNTLETQSQMSKRVQQSAYSFKSGSIPNAIQLAGIQIKELFYEKHQAREILYKPNQVKQVRLGVETQQKEEQAQYAVGLQLQLTNEIEAMRYQLETAFKHQRVIDLENEIRDRKRIVVNLLAENVTNIKAGLKDNAIRQRTDREQMLDAMLATREQKIRQITALTKQAKIRNDELEGDWGWHSEKVALRQIVRVLQDVVVLCQEKHFLAELLGAQKYVKVGEIERELNWPLQLQDRYGPDKQNAEYFSKKLRMQADEHNAILNMIYADIKTHDDIRDRMVRFLQHALGYGDVRWITTLEARWRRGRKQPAREQSAARKRQTQVEKEYEKLGPIEGQSQHFGSKTREMKEFKELAHNQTASRVLAHKLAERKGPILGFDFASEGSDPIGSQESDRSRQAMSEMPAVFGTEPQAVGKKGEQQDKEATKTKAQPEVELVRTKSLARPKSNELLEALNENDEDLQESPRSGGAKTGEEQSRQPIFSEAVERHTADQIRESFEEDDDDEHLTYKPGLERGLTMTSKIMREKKEKLERDLQAKQEQLKSVQTSAGGQRPSNWLSQIRKGQIDKDVNAEKKKTAALKNKYSIFIDESDSEDEKQSQMKGKELLGFLDNISRHLMVEQSVLDAWSKNDDRQQETLGNESVMPLGTVANTLESGKSTKVIGSVKSSLKPDSKLKAKAKNEKIANAADAKKQDRQDADRIRAEKQEQKAKKTEEKLQNMRLGTHKKTKSLKQPKAEAQYQMPVPLGKRGQTQLEEPVSPQDPTVYQKKMSELERQEQLLQSQLNEIQGQDPRNRARKGHTKQVLTTAKKAN